MGSALTWAWRRWVNWLRSVKRKIDWNYGIEVRISREHLIGPSESSRQLNFLGIKDPIAIGEQDHSHNSKQMKQFFASLVESNQFVMEFTTTTRITALILQLLRWERAFGLVRQYIEKIKGSFGFLLLLSLGRLVFYSILNILDLVTLIQSFKMELILIEITNLLRSFFILVLITFSCHRIKRKVTTANTSIFIDWL